MHNKTSKPALILALDNLETLEQRDPYHLIQELSDEGITWFKVGLELFTKQGPKVVEYIKNRSLNVFVDLKLFDIPNTVFRATKSVSALGADILTVHTLGGCEMLSSAKEASSGSQLKVIGVTLLTSFGSKDLSHLATHFKTSVERSPLTTALAKDAVTSEIDGVVCAVSDLEKIKPLFDKKQNTAIFLTPGIRLSGDSSDDQKNIATPKEACTKGATHLVVGRSILSLSGKQRANKIAQYINEIGLAHVE